MTTAARTIDPVTLEIIRHRLTVINEEAALTMARASGSPIVNEAYDCNTVLLTAGGEAFVIGPFIPAHAAAVEGLVAFVRAHYADDPGIRPGDMFATNDPYVAAIHQHDLAVAAPIFADGRVVMWSGSVLHHIDVGSPVPGGVTVGARSIYEESIPLAPIRIVEDGRLRPDLEREFTIRSRFPGAASLDLRAQVSANLVQLDRVGELCARYGADLVESAVATLLDAAATRFRRRLEALPDGRWRAISFCEHDGVEDAVYAARLTMTKRGGELELDFTESSDQAPATVNVALPATRGYCMTTICVYLGYGSPWIPAAVWRSVRLRTRSGSLVDPVWPAGCATASNGGALTLRTALASCLSSLLDADEDESAFVMAPGIGSVEIQSVSGVRDTGEPFGAWLVDSSAVGGGAREGLDGISTCTTPHAQLLIPNVEVNELYNPILYRWRREWCDSGGPGEFRGGVGGEHSYVLHHAGGAVASSVFGHSVEQAGAAGLGGGEPGLPNAAAHIPEGGQPRYLDPLDRLEIAIGDTFAMYYGGGGGLGDPLDREPAAVEADVRDGLVSERAARESYGVVPEDAAATAALRAQIRRDRLGGREPAPVNGTPAPGRRLSRNLVARDGTIACRHCGTDLGADAKAGMVLQEQAAAQAWPKTATLGGANRFVLRRFHCPGCATQLETEVNLRSEPHVRSVEPL